MDIPILIVLHLLGTQARQAPRISPPEAVQCPPDHLTAYTGRVTRWSRTMGQTSLTIATDWETTEVVTLKHPGTDDPRLYFLLNAGPFAARDWTRIETNRGTVREGLRATAWVCDDGRQPMIDWQPPPER
jgi:hypothetical protein